MRKLVPDDFAIPAGLEHERFRLRMLSINDVVKDFDAICDRVDRDGTPKPPFVSTVADNLVDLGWHQKEFELRRSFAYTVVAPDDSQVLGCVYIDPRRPTMHTYGCGCVGQRGRRASTRSSKLRCATGLRASGLFRRSTGAAALAHPRDR